ncbi:MAG: hypothetical protein RMJ31_07245 [Nitrososphaerota archaeon]|nr:hypothetical protein [Nitrososphaerales archaeon]MDW8045546.1 hypothetical protein [Nitrososphaerota archaeon]
MVRSRLGEKLRKLWETLFSKERIHGRCPHCNTLVTFEIEFNFWIFVILFIAFYTPGIIYWLLTYKSGLEFGLVALIPGIIYWLLTRDRVICMSCGGVAKLHPATKWILRKTGSLTRMPKCTYCGYEGAFIHDFDWFIAFILSLIFILPGIWYFLTHYERWICPKCRTPAGAWV